MMSILHASDVGWFISHAGLIEEIYNDCCIDQQATRVQLNPDLFKIYSSYKPIKIATDQQHNHNLEDEPEIQDVKSKYEVFRKTIPFNNKIPPTTRIDNQVALNAARAILNESGKHRITNAHGSNTTEHSRLQTINGTRFLFPQNCQFFCRDVADLTKHLLLPSSPTCYYDIILLDPPWWNKYIRRKRKQSSSHNDTYSMMYNEDLLRVPVAELLYPDSGMVVVWCTNSPQHFRKLTQEIMPQWGVTYCAQWYWVKVTESGEPICGFAKPPRKQPFERIVFGCRGLNERQLPMPSDGKLVVSVPSAIHSHKPPLIKLLEPFLPDNPACLEVFARYLMPNWTSYGLEALRLQHESLFNINIKQ